MQLHVCLLLIDFNPSEIEIGRVRFENTRFSIPTATEIDTHIVVLAEKD